jgi:hypothetical protein
LKPKSHYISLRAIAVIAVIASASGSLVMVIHAGSHNRSLLLPLLFVLWVSSPFMALLVANRVSKPWSALTRLTIYWLMLIIPAGCLLSFSGILSPRGTKAAFVFLITPLLSWLLIATSIPMAALLSRKKSNGSSYVGNKHPT